MQQFTATLAPSGPQGPQGPAGPPGPGGSAATTQTVRTPAGGSTVYVNDGLLPRFVALTINLNGKSEGVQVLCDQNDPPTTVITEALDPTQSGGVTVQLFFIVLPGYFYQCVVPSGDPSLVHWVEWQ